MGPKVVSGDRLADKSFTLKHILIGQCRFVGVQTNQGFRFRSQRESLANHIRPANRSVVRKYVIDAESMVVV